MSTLCPIYVVLEPGTSMELEKQLNMFADLGYRLSHTMETSKGPMFIMEHRAEAYAPKYRRTKK